MIVTMTMGNALAKLTQLLDVNAIKLPQDIMISLILNLVNVMKKDRLVLNVMKIVENVHAKKTLLETSVHNAALNSGDFQIVKLACVTLRVLKIIFVTSILATVIVNEVLRVIIATHASKDILDSQHVKPVVVMMKDPLVPLVMMPLEPVTADPTLLDTDAINVLLDILDSQTANLACVMMMVQEISLVMTTLENVLAKLT